MSNNQYNHRVSVRLDDDTKEIIQKIKEGFSLSSNSEAIRLGLHLFWKSLGTEAVDEEKLGEIIGEQLQS